MRIETLDVGAFTMDYCCFGRGGEALVILPGLSVQRVMGSAGAIESAYRSLAEDFTIYVFERRNELPPAYPVRDMARDTAAAMEALGLGSACLFGASQGGMLAMLLAMEHRQRVRKLVLGSTTARMTEARYRRVFQGWAELARAKDAAALYLAFGEALYPRRMFDKLRPLLLDAARAVTDEDLRRFAVMTEGLRGFDAEDGLANIACPTLVLGAKDDAVVGAEASERIAARVAGAELFMYEGFGHAAYDLAPDYRSRMRRFLLGPGAV